MNTTPKLGSHGGMKLGTGSDIRQKVASLVRSEDLRQVALSAAAVHKLSRLLAKDPVTSPLRAPFTGSTPRSQHTS